MTDLEPILRRDLGIIAHNWPDLLNLPHTPSGDKVDTSMSSPTPIAVSVLSLRFDAAMLLASWAHLVHDEMHLSTGLDLLATVPICRFLDRHAGFLATHPSHDLRNRAVEEIGYYANAIVELIEQTKAHKIPVAGSCPYCDANLIAYVRDCDWTIPSDVRCTGEPQHAWMGELQWHILDRMLNIRPVIVRHEDAARRFVSAITQCPDTPRLLTST